MDLLSDKPEMVHIAEFNKTRYLHECLFNLFSVQTYNTHVFAITYATAGVTNTILRNDL